MENTKIEWADHTCNFWIGCTKVSPACDHCYAERNAGRFGHAKWGKDEARRITIAAYWRQPLRWNRDALAAGRPARVFCGSEMDFMERNPQVAEARQQAFRVMEATPNLDWLLLTKRPQEYEKFLPQAWLAAPRPNVWLMTTVESAEYLWRIEAMMRAPAAVYGLSLEPLLGPLRLPKAFLDLGQRSWVIVGGESGPGSRPTQPDWARSLRDQCIEARVPFHFKQWGQHDAQLVKLRSKHDSGRELDGRTWDQLPLDRAA